MAKRRVKSQQYGRLAEFYDALTPYAPAMNRQARRRALGSILDSARTVCDLACGSGSTSIDLAQAGKSVFAVDFAPHFCRTLRARAKREKLDITVIESDMRTFRVPRRVDLVLCEFSAVNNLVDRRALVPTFAAVARALEPGGHFLFDVNTETSFATQIPGTNWLETPQFKLVMRGSLSDKGRRAQLELEWFVQQGKLFSHERETIVNLCWSDAEIRSALTRAGLKLVRTFDGVDIRPKMKGAVRGTDVYYLSTKPSSERTRR